MALLTSLGLASILAIGSSATAQSFTRSVAVGDSTAQFLEEFTGAGEILTWSDCNSLQSGNLSNYDDAETLTIRVVYHSLYADESDHLDATYAQALIDHLNSAFSGAECSGETCPDTGIRFTLAETKFYEIPDLVPWTTPFSAAADSFKQLNAVDPSRFLNLYLVRTAEGTAPATVGGFGTYPWNPYSRGWADFVHMDPRLHPDVVGYNPELADGDVLVALVGYYLGLYDTYVLGCDPPNSDCYAEGDLLCDTPSESEPHFGCPGGQIVDCGGQILMNNFMSALDDRCVDRFTEEQALRMRCVIRNFRHGLLETDAVLTGIPISGSLNDGAGLVLDMTGDGHDEVLVLSNGSTEAIVYNYDEVLGEFAETPISFTVSGTIAGTALADVNGDGLADIFLATNSEGWSEPRLFVYLGTSPSTFLRAEIDLPTSLEEVGGVAAADYDGDGVIDLFVSGYPRGLLLRGVSATVYEDVTFLLPSDLGRVRHAAWADFDNDGDVDLAVSSLEVDYYHSNGSGLRVFAQEDGAFVDVTINWDLGYSNPGALEWSDFDGDGFLDLLVGTNETSIVWTALDLVRSMSAVFRNTGSSFVELGEGSELNYRLTRKIGGSELHTIDLNRDGMNDLYIASRVLDATWLSGSYFPAQGSDLDWVLRNSGTFVDFVAAYEAGDALSAAVGDFNGDGAPDVFVLKKNQEHVALLNADATAPSSSLTVRLAGRAPNTWGVGAHVYITLPDATRRVYYVGGGGIYCAKRPEVVFYLGSASMVDNVMIRWPSGVVESVNDVPAGSEVLFFEPAVGLVDETSTAGLSTTGTPYASSFRDYSVNENPAFGVSREDGATLHFRRTGISGGGVPLHFNEALDVGFQPTTAERGMASADYDGDGDIDLFVAHATLPRLYNFDATRTPKYVDVADSILVGANTLRAVAQDSWSGSWADYDGDGYLDLYITRAESPSSGVSHTPASIDDKGLEDVLLRNLGYAGPGFEDVTVAAGLYDANSETVSASWADINNDGRPDLYVSWLGAYHGNFTLGWSPLYLNNGDGTFTDITYPSGQVPYVSAPKFTRLGFVNAAAWVDLDNDGYLDIALARQNTSGQGILQNVMVCLNAGQSDPGDLTVELPGLPNSTVPMRDVRAHDLDNNTLADLVFSPVGTGTEHFYMGYSTQSGPAWVEQAAALGIPANTGTGKSVMLADLNKDGDLDVFLGRSSGESVYLQNRPVVGTGEGPTNNFLRVALQNQSQVGGTWNRGNAVEGVSARVLVECPATATLPAWKRAFHVDGGSGLGGQDDRLLVVGLGQYEEGTVTVFWPDGATTTKAFTSGDINKTTEVFEIEDVHAPALISNSVTGYVQPQSGGYLKWIFEWKTERTTDESLDRVIIRPKPGRSGIPVHCDVSQIERSPGDYGVTHTITVVGSDLLHRMEWEGPWCDAPCDFEFDVYTKFKSTEESKLESVLSIPVCVQ